ncbi:MAG: glycoside hydrolase family 27 protein [Planctomycetota bacterium]
MRPPVTSHPTPTQSTPDREARAQRVHALTPNPPRGWNSFDCYGCSANQRVAAANLEAFAQKLLPAGYDTFVIDAGWFGEYHIPEGWDFTNEKHAARVRVDRHGRFLPSNVSFPNGLQPLIDRAHELGIKFGIHLMRGVPRAAVEQQLPILGTPGLTAADIANTDDTCPWCHYMYGVDVDRPGAQAYYDSVFQLFASWGIDFIKVDDVIHKPREIEAITTAIDRCGRDIVLSLSPGGEMSVDHMATYRQANLFRVTADIWDRRNDLDRSFAGWESIQDLPLDGVWPDLDMIPFGHLMVWNPDRGDDASANLAGWGTARHDGFTHAQRRTFITQRALAASPLFFGGELTMTDDDILRLVTHPGMLECQANGVVGRLAYRQDHIDVWVTPDRHAPDRGWFGVFNRNPQPWQGRVPLEPLGPLHRSAKLHDLWRNTPLTPEGDHLSLTLDADDVLFVRIDDTGNTPPTR